MYDTYLRGYKYVPYMARKRLFESQTIDYSTGEVKSITTVTVRDTNERFGMYRSTEGLEWIKEFTGKEMHMMMLLNHLENIDTRIVNISPLIKEEIYRFFHISKSTFSDMVGRMEGKKFLIRLTPNDILLNPSFFYKGSSKDLLGRIKAFNEEYEKRRKETPQVVDNQSKSEEKPDNSTQQDVQDTEYTQAVDELYKEKDE